jgi:riboflavin kinase/FMN adenylyltransferase
VVLTFDPNPAEIVAAQPPMRLSTLAQRLLLLESLGVDAAFVLPFDRAMSQESPKEFVDQILLGALGASSVVVGENFRFGHRAAGDVEALREFGAPGGMTVDAVPLLRQELLGRKDVPISSTEIRALVANGDISAATRGLARPHRVEGEVVEGDRRGRDLGYPTANLRTTALSAIPSDGVYAGRLVVSPYGTEQRTFPAAISVGDNPTFVGQTRRIEAFAIDAPADLNIYNTHVAVDFVSRLRRQVAFTSTESLVAQMAKDVLEARAHLGVG